MVKKVVILGASGMLGHKMLQVLSEKYDTYGTLRKKNTSSILKDYNLCEKIDAMDFTSVSKALDKIDPDVIVNCVGIIKQLPESNDWNISHAINSEFPHKLNIYSIANDIQFIHISTDCVFDGKHGMYNENDIPNATDIYGRTKFSGEVLDALILRTSIIGREINTNHGLLEWFLSKSGSNVQGYKKSIFSGVTTNELSLLVSSIICSGANLKGLYHVAADSINKFDLITSINKYLYDKVIIEPVDGEIIDRSLNGNKIKHEFGYVPPHWNVMLEDMLVNDTTNYGRYNDIHS
jgi:dTDP-4-dehydrorhamnose reductase